MGAVMGDSTWKKKIRVGGRSVQKQSIRRHYEKRWREDPAFRKALAKRGLIVVHEYGHRKVVRAQKPVTTLDALEDVVRRHGVQFIAPSAPFLDVDVPQKMRRKTASLYRSIERSAAQQGLRPSEVVQTPRGRHYVFEQASRGQVRRLAKRIAETRDDVVAGRTSRSKIVVDAANRKRALPGSLSWRGGAYKRIQGAFRSWWGKRSGRHG